MPPGGMLKLANRIQFVANKLFVISTMSLLFQFCLFPCFSLNAFIPNPDAEAQSLHYIKPRELKVIVMFLKSTLYEICLLYATMDAVKSHKDSAE